MSKYDYTFTIDRATWLSGSTVLKFGPRAASVMCDSRNRKCCLGFYCASLGAKGMKKHEDVGPQDLQHRDALPKKAEWLLRLSDSPWFTSVAQELMRINDNCDIDDKHREDLLRAKFAAHRIRVLFQGRYPNNYLGL